jgi:hypothetical protein
MLKMACFYSKTAMEMTHEVVVVMVAVEIYWRGGSDSDGSGGGTSS